MGKKSNQKQSRSKRQSVAQMASPKSKQITSSALGEKLQFTGGAMPQAVLKKPTAQSTFDDTTMVRSDIRKTLIIFAGIAVLLVGALMIQSRTSVLQSAGKSLVTFLNL
jgi:hypothetical protein